jgi:glucuronosyltransferase
MRGLIVILAVFSAVSAGNILYLNGVPSPSHHLWNNVFVEALAGKGYNVTFVSVDGGKHKTANVHKIQLEKAYEAFFKGEDSLDVLYYADEGAIEALIELPEVFEAVCDGALNSKGLDEILAYPDTFKFDLVIYDFSFGPCLLPLLTKFNYPPLIAATAFAIPPYSSDLIGGQKYPAYIPHYDVTYSTDMSFLERFHNTLTYFVDWM